MCIVPCYTINSIDPVDQLLSNVDMFEMPLKITRGERTFCDRAWSWFNPPGTFSGYNLWLVVGGEGTLQTARAAYTLRPGDCFLLSMWETNIGKHNPDNPLVVPWLCFDALDAKGRVLPVAQLPRPIEHRRLPNFSFFDELFQRMLDRKAEGQGHADEALMWLRAALAEIAWQDRRANLSGPDLERSLMIDELCTRIRERPEQFGNMDSLAEKSHCSVDHLIRIFKQHKGVTPWEYVIRCRIEKASNLLRFSSQTVSHIADLLGHADIYSFCKQFKARTGKTPSEYRKR